MATDDRSLTSEVRVYAGVDELALSNEDMRLLISRAKDTIESDTGSTFADFYADRDLEQALFWKSCIYAAEALMGDETVTIGSIKIDESDDRAELIEWERRYQARLASVSGDSASGFGIGRVQRSDRRYG
jgi:hypothetical protein